MGVVAMRNAIVARIRESMPALIAVESHTGEFTAAELDRYLKTAPSVVVVCRGMVGSSDEGGVFVRAYQWACVVIARDEAKPGAARVPKGDLALALSDHLAALVLEERHIVAKNGLDTGTVGGRQLARGRHGITSEGQSYTGCRIRRGPGD